MHRIRSPKPGLPLMLGLSRLSEALRSALKFHASFDGTLAASHAAGDPALYWAPTLKQRQEAKPGLPASGEVQHAIGAGRFGDARSDSTTSELLKSSPPSLAS